MSFEQGVKNFKQSVKNFGLEVNAYGRTVGDSLPKAPYFKIEELPTSPAVSREMWDSLVQAQRTVFLLMAKRLYRENKHIWPTT